MDFKLDYSLRLHTDPQYKSLYQWAINEIDAQGRPVCSDQIPWGWTLYFTGTSCSLDHRLDIAGRYKASGEEHQIDRSQTITIPLKSGVLRNGALEDEVFYSMFGTNRTVEDFMLQISPLSDDSSTERCSSWGIVSYDSEIDFRTETINDCVYFYLHVKLETFSQYVSLIEKGAISSIIFSVGLVDGFYAEWSPAISTSRVKVLAGDGHKVDIPTDFQGAPPRLGKVQDVRLLFRNTINLTGS